MLPRFFAPFLLLAAAIAAPTPSSDAPLVVDSGNKKYAAHFSHSATSIVDGTIEFRPNQDGQGVTVSVKLNISDSSLGPFAYHVHTERVPGDGNCTGTLGHFDPYKPEKPRAACNPGDPKACEIGDLSGKHVRIPQYPEGSIMVQSEHKDAYISLNPDAVAFIGNRSIVIHNSVGNGTRIACANLAAV